jgi:S1-C subfamily serine protease
MNFRDNILVFVGLLLIGQSSALLAANETENTTLTEKTQLDAEYTQALQRAQQERQAASSSIARANAQLHAVSERSSQQSREATAQTAAQETKLADMHEELNLARRQLSETSREMARVNREIARQRSNDRSTRHVSQRTSQPVIGVILGDEKDVGIEVLGVSPDGPSERAGLQQGDVIVAMGGRVLAAEGADNIRNEVIVAMQEVTANEAVIVSVERGDQTLDISVIPEVREPLTWHSVTRLRSAPVSPAAPANVRTIERIVVPEIDTMALAEQIEEMQFAVDERKMVMQAHQLSEDSRELEIELHEMSEMGDFVLHDANVWFGWPMARGLKLAEINSQLGEYFKTDRGVLVLSADADNDLHLESGDVVLQVGETEVNSPADFMRALRKFKSGQELTMDIKRNQKDKSLTASMPARETRVYDPQPEKSKQIRIIKSTK